MHDILHSLFEYDPLTGILVWRPRARRGRGRDRRKGKVGYYDGKEAGWVDNNGYRRLDFTVDGVLYRMPVAQVIWIMQTGFPPAHEIDHIDRDPSNNRWVNLRDIDHSGQMQNRERKKKGLWPTGVVRKGSRFQAAIAANKKWMYLGTFFTPGDAHRAYLAARERLHVARG